MHNTLWVSLYGYLLCILSLVNFAVFIPLTSWAMHQSQLIACNSRQTLTELNFFFPSHNKSVAGDWWLVDKAEGSARSWLFPHGCNVAQPLHPLSRATGGGRNSEEKSVSKAFAGIFHHLLLISHWPPFSGGLPSLQKVWEGVVYGPAFILEEGEGREDWNGCWDNF